MDAAGVSEARFAAYVEQLSGVLRHVDRREPLHDYCLGLLLPIERKSVEPMAAVTAPAQVAAKHQSLLHFGGNAPWSDAAMLAKVSELVLPVIERSGAVEAWIIDDTGFPKKGRHSVGVSRQYCGQLGKQDNCQVAVSLSLANHDASLPVAYRLYLPEEWASDRHRRDKAKVPETIGFRTKSEIALEQIKSAYATGLPPGVVLMDAGYGNDTALRAEITAMNLRYVVGIAGNTAVWAPGTAPLPALPGSGRGRPPVQDDNAANRVADMDDEGTDVHLNGATAEPVRHRQTKGAATDMFDLPSPRHISTLRRATDGPDRFSREQLTPG